MSTIEDKTCAAIGMVMQQVIRDIIIGEDEVYKEPKGLEHNVVNNLYVVCKELLVSDKEDPVVKYYALGITTPKHRYVYDIIDIIHRPYGIMFRFQGLEIPAVIFPNILYLDAIGIESMLRIIYKSDPALIKMINELAGDQDGTKKTNK